MERAEVERRLGEEIPRILAETTIMPVHGRRAGRRLHPDARCPRAACSRRRACGAGDVLTQVNDVPIDSLATLIGLWPRLQDESTLHAVVLRNGQPVSLTVSLR